MPDSAVVQPPRQTGLLDLSADRSETISSRAAVAGTAPRLPVPFRPMTMLDKLDGAFGIIKARPTRVVALAATVVIPAHLLESFLVRNNAGFFEVLESINRPSSASSLQSGNDIVMSLLAVMVAAFSYAVLGALLTVLVTGWYAGSDPTIGDALRQVGRRFHVLLASFAVLLPVKLFVMLCYLPALFFIPVFLVVSPVIVAERAGPIVAIRRSWQLTMRRFGSVLLTWLLTVIVEFAVGQILLLLVQMLGTLMPSSLRWLAIGVGSALVGLVVAPFAVGVAILQYLDLRARTEGLDVQLQADRVLPEPQAVSS